MTKTCIKPGWLFILFMAINVQVIHAQALYAITQKISGNLNYVSMVNPANGNVNIVSASSVSKFLMSGISGFNPIAKHFFFISPTDSLVVVDVTTGNAVAKNKTSVTTTHYVVAIEFNCADTTLYAMLQNKADNKNYLSKVNPLTGIFTLISPAPVSKAMLGGISTLDPLGRKFYYVTSGDTLFGIDLSTGAIGSKCKTAAPGAYMTMLIEFNPQDNLLYAISQTSPSSTPPNRDYLSTIHPANGSVTLVSPTPLAKFISTGISSLDPIGKQFYFMNTGDTLYSVDMNTGMLLNKNKISVSGTHFNGLIEFDKGCALVAPTGINDQNGRQALTAFPNPFSHQVEVRGSFNNSRILISDVTGRIVQDIDNVNGESVIIYRHTLPAGLYLLRQQQNSRVIATQRLLITD